MCKKICTVLLLMLSMLIGNMAYAAIPEIRNVDLYPSGARFVFAINEPVGDVKFELPGAFDEASVHVLTPTGLEGLQAVRRTRENWVPQALEQIKSDCEVQKAVLAELNALEMSHQQTLNLLKTLKPEKENSTTKELIAYMRESRELRFETENELAKLRVQIQHEKEKLRLLEDELKRRSPANADSQLEVTGQSLGKGEVLFEARTSRANWSPSYIIEMDSTTGKIDAQLYASASQKTGLDYTGKVTLHTHEPDRSVRVPMLNPLRVDLRQPVPPTFMRSNALPRTSNMTGAAMDFEEDIEESYAPLMEARKVVQESITLTDRAVEGDGKLLGDGSTMQISLGHIDMTCTPEFLLIPEQQSDAWILAAVESAPSELIPARAELFVDGAPAGNTNIPQYGIEQAKLPFGRVPLLTAKKEPLISKTGNGWFSDAQSNGYRLKITNSTGVDRTVTVRDRLPIPTNDKVTLEVRKISPEPTERDPENRLTWKLDIKAGETIEILVDYAVNYPSGEAIQYK